MAETNIWEKKRKRQSEGEEKPKKKKVADQSSNDDDSSIKVLHVSEEGGYGPIVATSPGLTLPSTMSMKAYSKAKKKSGKSLGNELLLYSGQHPQMDYVAREFPKGAPEKLFKHFVGVYDPETKVLQLVEARHMEIRASLRSENQEAKAIQQLQRTKNGLTARQQLGMEFGNKKAKRLINSYTENAVTSRQPQDVTAEDVQSAIKSDPTASAVLESMAASAASAPTKESLQSAIDNAKPRPKHHADANSIEEVYPVKELIGEEMLAATKVKPWLDAFKNKQDIATTSRFVSHRIQALCKKYQDGEDDDEDENSPLSKLRVLKYMLLLINFSKCLTPTKHGGKKMPSREFMKQKLGEENHIIDLLRRRFSNGSEMTKWHVDNLMTHLAVFALIADDFVTDIRDLQEDLGFTSPEMSKYFREVGATVVPMKEKERLDAELTKAQAQYHKLAKLKIPLEFPQLKQARQRARR